MAKFAYLDEYGSTLYTAWVSDAADASDDPLRVTLGDDAVDAEVINSAFVNGEWHIRPSGIPRHFCLDPDSSMWVDSRPLEQVKTAAWDQIKTEREARMRGTFTHAGNTYDIDPVSWAGACIDAREAIIAGETHFTQMWVLADNTVTTLSAEEVISTGRACKAVVSDLWAISQYLRSLVDAATTITEVNSITWP